LPVPHFPQERGVPEQDGSAPADAAANVENFFESLADPQRGHLVPFQSFERIRISLSDSHFSQWNS
jgi:hypothetical protein